MIYILVSYLFFKVFLFVCFLTLRLLFFAAYCALLLPVVKFLASFILLNLIWRGLSNQINRLVWIYKDIPKRGFDGFSFEWRVWAVCMDFVLTLLAFHKGFFFFLTSWFWIIDTVNTTWINVVLSSKLKLMKCLWTLLHSKWAVLIVKLSLILICMWVSGKGLSLLIAAVLLLTEISSVDLGDFTLNTIHACSSQFIWPLVIT